MRWHTAVGSLTTWGKGALAISCADCNGGILQPVMIAVSRTPEGALDSLLRRVAAAGAGIANPSSSTPRSLRRDCCIAQLTDGHQLQMN